MAKYFNDNITSLLKTISLHFCLILSYYVDMGCVCGGGDHQPNLNTAKFGLILLFELTTGLKYN